MMETDDCCPLCMEDMDVTDRNFRPCKCGYQICLFCYRHIKDDLNGLCPACRTPYDEANATFVTPDPQEMARMAREKKLKEAREKKEQAAKEKREAEMKSRQEVQAAAAARASAPSVASSAASSGGAVAASSSAAARQPPARPSASSVKADPRDLSSIRTLPQRTAIFVSGLSPRIAKEEIMRRNEYFGQYGRILNVKLNTASSSASGPPSLSATITYANRDEAEQAILAVDGVVLDARTLHAQFSAASRPLRPSLSSQEDAPATASPDKEEGAPAQEAPRSGRDIAPPPAARETPSSAPPSRVAAERAAANGSGSWGDGAVALTAAPAPISAAAPVRSGTASLSAVGASQPSPATDPPYRIDDHVAAGRAVQPPAAASRQAAASNGAACGSIGDSERSVSTAAADLSLSARHLQPATPSGLCFSELGALGSVPMATGSEAEPWSMSFDAFLSAGIVSDDMEETSVPGTSRFARFFKDSVDEEEGDDMTITGGSAMAVDPLSAIKLDDVGGGNKEEDWQQAGFRALLPNVNISFSPLNLGPLDNIAPPFGTIGGASSGGSSQGAQQGSSKACGAPNGRGGSGAVGGSVGSSASGGIGVPLGGSIGLKPERKPGGSGLAPTLGPSALNGLPTLGEGGSLAGSLSSSPPSGEVPLLLSSSGGLLGNPLPGSSTQLSSQLQSLLQGSPPNGTSSAAGARAVGSGSVNGAVGGQGGVVGSSLLQNGESASAGGMWSGSNNSLMPGWLPAEGLLADGLDSMPKDQSAAAAKAAKKDGSAAVAGAVGGSAVGVGAVVGSVAERNSVKVKKRGAGNRGKADLKK